MAPPKKLESVAMAVASARSRGANHAYTKIKTRKIESKIEEISRQKYNKSGRRKRTK